MNKKIQLVSLMLISMLAYHKNLFADGDTPCVQILKGASCNSISKETDAYQMCCTSTPSLQHTPPPVMSSQNVSNLTSTLSGINQALDGDKALKDQLTKALDNDQARENICHKQTDSTQSFSICMQLPAGHDFSCGVPETYGVYFINTGGSCARVSSANDGLRSATDSKRLTGGVVPDAAAAGQGSARSGADAR
jgi:hypothetical protein